MTIPPLTMLPTPNAVVTWALPQGIPLLRDGFLDRTGLFASSLDPDAEAGDPGLFGPDSITWSLVGQASQALAGLRAALLQTLSVPIPTATDSTGKFYEDFLGRVGRTGAFVQAQNLGSMDEVRRSARRVRAMHRTVRGTGRDGTRFDATDTHQTAWVSMTLTDSFLVMTERFGRGRLRREDADAFVKEQSTHAALLDQRVDLDEVFADPDQRAALRAGTLPLPLIDEGELPTTLDGLRSTMAAWTAELSVSRLTRALLDATVQLDGVGEPARGIARPFMLATLATMPDEWHDLVAPGSNRHAERLAAEAVQYPLALLQAVLGELPAVAAARARVAAGTGRS
ncbi:oxygenase MpaB family protein [Dermatobacter hominis]|uniref:oxygenase MpaB family protein n=1 Tax=Dermatobacter hominis TaxID=2884263 RepID=UPI001D100B89|nr:oxygenase MpaB family protein [Dermatobacter hominis]UDY35089.1 DUF2236 domain-containing protein [Dermatobacter hominis]